MAPQTRSTTKPSPGRSTRNSVYGRPPPSPAKPRKSSSNDSPARTAPTHDTALKGKVTSDVSKTQGTPWLACRDAYGVTTTVAVSETGEGVHVRWYYPDEDREIDEDEDADVEMTVDEERGVTPPTTAGPSSVVRRPFPHTPMALQPYDAGSVIQTPIKRAKPLQPSPPRIGDKGVRCLYEKGGVLRELNGGVRVVLRHALGSSANLSREQVERLEKEREEKIVQVQVKKLLEQKQRLEEEEARFSYEDEMETDDTSLQGGLRREGTNGTVLVSHNELSYIVPPASLEEIERASGFSKGPNGELLDRHGRQMLGREGTILIHSAYGSPRRIRREEAFRLSTESVESQSSSSEANRLCRVALFGAEGTELID
ncbi:hypothetical protein OG21DRAFT_1521548 [Imleria badia]|nr:hypothetical protein OG21DRAFT_1521548 [Imleria badia]